MGKKIYDISQALRPGIPVWPGDVHFKQSWTMQLDANCPVNVSELSLSAHTGSHADAPLHYANGAVSSGQLDLEPYLGPCQVIDARRAGALVRVEDIEERLLSRSERVIFKTYEAFPHAQWDSDFTAIDPATIDLLAAKGCLLVGLDSPSLDPETSKELPSHQRVLAHDMRVLEGLVLDDVPEGLYELIALPLKLTGGDASPVRAVLREV
ncbi:MAG: arylformamidase [Alphaproteobacteria bacterium]